MAVSLVYPQDMPEITGFCVPSDFYWVIQSPVPLAGMSYPESNALWQNIWGAGFRDVVNLTEESPSYDATPLILLHSVKLEDLVYGGPPCDPAKEEKLIREVVDVVMGELSAGKGVVIHCAGGTGRTGTTTGCILRTMGLSASTVISYLDKLMKARGKHGWPESKWQGELVERF